MLELPGFSKELKTKLNPLLEAAQAQFEKAVDVGKGECILYEFDCDLTDALQGLSQVHFYRGEYRTRALEYKYAEYLKLDK